MRQTKQKLQQTGKNDKSTRKTAMADAREQQPLHPENAPQEFGHRYRSTFQIRKRICQSAQQAEEGARAELLGNKTTKKKPKTLPFFQFF